NPELARAALIQNVHVSAGSGDGLHGTASRHAGNATTPRAYPQLTGAVAQQRVHVIDRQAVGGRVQGSCGSAVEPIQPAFGPEPQVAVPVVDNRHHTDRWKRSVGRDHLKAAAILDTQPTVTVSSAKRTAQHPDPQPA